MLEWLQKGMGDSRGSMGAALGSIDALVNPAAGRSREILDAQKERIVEVPSPGDRLFDDGTLVIELPADATAPSDPDGGDAAGPDAEAPSAQADTDRD